MTKLLRLFVDALMVLYSLFAVYYLTVLFVNFYKTLFLGYGAGFITDNLVSFLFIYGIVFGGHIGISIWMYADFSKRSFTSNSKRVFWLATLVAGLAPLYYFYQGRNPLK